MKQSLANVVLHFIFSTKNREPLIDLEIEPELHAYLATVCKTCDSPAIKIGGARTMFTFYAIWRAPKRSLP